MGASSVHFDDASKKKHMQSQTFYVDPRIPRSKIKESDLSFKRSPVDIIKLNVSKPNKKPAQVNLIKNQMIAHKRSISGETVIGTFPTKPTMRKAADYKFSINQEELSEKDE
jgi:hypothetical protein